jgi:para-aminobenzoate synthetase component I
LPAVSAPVFSGDPFSAWWHLNQQHPAPHSSFFQLANGDCVFGVSPERFLQIRNGVMITEPIKGSRQRGDTPLQDQQLGGFTA